MLHSQLMRALAFVVLLLLSFAPREAPAQFNGCKDGFCSSFVAGPPPGPATCTGGTSITAGGNTIFTFTASGTLTCSGTFPAKALIVAGGGGAMGGGGGAGGYCTTEGTPTCGLGSSVTIPSGATAVTIGAGGAGGTSPFTTDGSSGANSVLGSIVTATGGGGGGHSAGPGLAGGSGGGGGIDGGMSQPGGTGSQGNNGGASFAGGGASAAGGGGGAGAVGGNASSATGGNGGNGVSNTISGASVAYAGGGAGAPDMTTDVSGTGGTGGGGNAHSNAVGSNGTANTGGGAGGTSVNGGLAGGAGGSGIVIVSCATTACVSGNPTIASVSPNTGTTAGGTSVAIGGTNYGTGGASVTAIAFGVTPAASFSCSSSTACAATSPAGTGVVDVTVTTAAGTSAISTADQFTYSVATTTWSTVDAAAASWTLSGGNLTAVPTITGAWNSIRASGSKTSGQLYVEIKCTTAGSGLTSYGVGFANAGFTATSYLGSSNYSGGVFATGTFVDGSGFMAGTSNLPNVVAALNDVFGLLIDFSTGNVWVSKNNLNVNTGSAPNPSTDPPQMTFTPGTVGALFPALSEHDPLDGAFTLHSTGASQTYTPPAGFTPWG